MRKVRRLAAVVLTTVAVVAIGVVGQRAGFVDDADAGFPSKERYGNNICTALPFNGLYNLLKKYPQ